MTDVDRKTKTKNIVVRCLRPYKSYGLLRERCFLLAIQSWVHYPVNPSSDHFHTDEVVPSSDHCCSETLLPPSDHFCIDIVAPSGDQSCIDIAAPSSDHNGTMKLAPSSDHLHTKIT